MAGLTAVCKNCTERYLACWGSCEKYLKARSEYDAKRAEYLKKRKADCAAKNVQFNSMIKSQRKRGLR